VTESKQDPMDSSWNMVEELIFHVFDSAATDQADTHVRLGPRLTELGWADIESEYGVDAAELLFRARARSLVQSECLDRLMIAELSPVLDGSVDAVVFPGIAAGGCPGTEDEFSGILIGPPRGRVAVAISQPGGRVHVGALDAARLQSEPMNTFDATCEWTRVHGIVDVARIEATRSWTDAVAAARCGLSTELVELGAAIVDLAVGHATGRTQFGRPIGAFQSPRHALAEAHARLEGARALAGEAWRSGGAFAALVAKAAAGRAHRTAADAAIQVCGAIGLTMEHDLHRYIARGMQLDALLGSYRQLEAELADRLVGLDVAREPLPTVIACA
jgi:hypothetical protein